MLLLPWQATDDDRDWRDDVEYALRVAGLSRDEAAFMLDVPRSQVSAQLALTQHWSGWRERRLPRAFHVALYKRRLARWDHEVLEKSELLDLVTSVKRMAKAIVPGAMQVKEIA